MKIKTIILSTLFIFNIVSILAQEQYNVVLIVSDQHRIKSTGCYGDEIVKTPNIDFLASQGVKFTQCYTPAPICAPARAAIFTGLFPYQNKALYHKAPVKAPNGRTKYLGPGKSAETSYRKGIVTMAEFFQEKGYLTSGIGKMHVHGEMQKGVDDKLPQGNFMGFDTTSLRYYTHFPGGHYEDHKDGTPYKKYREMGEYKREPLNQEYKPTLVENEEDVFDMLVTQQSSDFIKQAAKKGKPFFTYVGLEKPHMPFTTIQRLLDLYDPQDFSFPPTYNEVKKKGKYPWVPDWIHNGLPLNHPEKAKNVMASYYACITEVDENVGKIIQTLKETGQLDKTIIIYTTDHGEHLFDHGLRGKHNMFDDAVRVPFIVYCPSLLGEKPKTITSLTNLLDIYPTLCDLLNWEVPKNLSGRSLKPALIGEKENPFPSRRVFCEYHSGNYKAFPEERYLPSRMMRYWNMKYIYTHGMIDQLYYMKDDPDELKNLAFNQAQEEKLLKMRLMALDGWNFSDFPLMKLKLKDKKTLTWTAFEGVKEYIVFGSSKPSPELAKIVKRNINAESIKISELSETYNYYWVMAVPKYSRTVKRFGEKPVLMEKLPPNIPLTNKLSIK